MPIKNLTDNVLPAFPRLGKLRKGSPQENGHFGKEQSFWRFASERTDVTAAFTAAYGAQPVSLTVYLPYAQVEDNFATWREEWTAGGLVHRCDGETMTIWRTPAGTYDRTPKACPNRGQAKPACKPVGRLTIIIPELIQAGFVGYVTMETHSLNDLLSIQATLLAVTEARGNALGLRGVPFILRRVPEMISTPTEDGKRVRRQKYLVKLEPLADWVALQLEASRKLAFGNEQRLALGDGRHVDTLTGEIDELTNDADDEEVEEGDWTPEDDPQSQATMLEVIKQRPAPAAPTTAAPTNGAEPKCPKCGGPMWDNRVGKKNPKAPDYKCKDKACDGVIWPGAYHQTAPSKKIELAEDVRPRWKELANLLASMAPEYATADGAANHQAIGNALQARGYTKIDAANIDAAFNGLYAPEPATSDIPL